jgi:hypothetical protein
MPGFNRSAMKQRVAFACVLQALFSGCDMEQGSVDLEASKAAAKAQSGQASPATDIASPHTRSSTLRPTTSPERDAGR